MKTDLIFAAITGLLAIALIVVAIITHAWYHIGTGCGLALLSAAYYRESKRI
jgi:hypothetical protein